LVQNEDFFDNPERAVEEVTDGGVVVDKEQLTTKDKLFYADGMKVRNKLENTLEKIYHETAYNHSLILKAVVKKKCNS
jgi:hypothetical protein